MFYSSSFLFFSKETPSDAVLRSHQLLLRAGFIMQLSSGLYIWLTPGLNVMKKIEKIIDDEMRKIQSSKMLMPCIQTADLWKASGRYEDYGREMLRMKDRHGRDILFGPTNEEVATFAFSKVIQSYKRLPIHFYHIQWKFRDEIRPRSGLLRAREFLMKDAYSFDTDKKSAVETYYKFYNAYLNIFQRIGVKTIPVQTKDAGPIGGDLNHEFHIPTMGGDSKILFDSELLNKDLNSLYEVLKSKQFESSIFDDSSAEDGKFSNMSTLNSIEVGHIFYFGDKYSKSMGIGVSNQDGAMANVEMGSYGIGISRIIAAIAEYSNDEKGLVWPINIAPFDIYIVDICAYDGKIEIHNIIENKFGLSCVYDDSDDSFGVKMSRADLMGIPWKVVIGKNWTKNNLVELKDRANCIDKLLTMEEALRFIIDNKSISKN